MTRLQHAEAIVNGEAPPVASSDRFQRPLFYYPGLPAEHFYDPTRFPWTRELLDAFAVISREVDECLSVRRGFEPVFPKYADAGKWATLWFTLYGRIYEDNCQAFPQTMRALKAVPNPAGWTSLSALEPGAHVRPHCGVTNAKLRLHYAIKAEPGSRLRVRDGYYEWQAGEIMIFDDSYEHEVWVKGTTPRIVLIVDFYHPALRPDEIAFLERFEAEPSMFLKGQSLRSSYQSGITPSRNPPNVEWVYARHSERDTSTEPH